MSIDASTERARALATEHLWEMHTPRYLGVVALGSLIPAALIAPLFQWAVGPDFAGAAGLGKSYLIVAVLLAAIFACAVPLCAGLPEAAVLRRTVARFSVYEQRVEVRDGHDVVLGDTADGTLQLRAINRQAGQQMVGAVQLVYSGGLITVTPDRNVAPTPGQPAQTQLGRWHTVSSGVYAHLLRLAS